MTLRGRARQRAASGVEPRPATFRRLRAGSWTAAPPSSPRARAAGTYAGRHARRQPTARSSSSRRWGRSSPARSRRAGRWCPGSRAAAAAPRAGRSAWTERRAKTSAFFDGPRTLEFAAAFEPVNDQAVGFGRDLDDFPGAAFTTGSAGDPIRLYAWSGAGASSETLTPLPSVRLHDPHRFRIEWSPSSVRFFVDGTLVATHSVAIDAALRPVVSDFRPFGAGVRAEWLRMGGYAASGTFTSRVLDGGPGTACLADARGPEQRAGRHEPGLRHPQRARRPSPTAPGRAGRRSAAAGPSRARRLATSSTAPA